MITGFNTDIKHLEKVYHIQTEDKGVANPYIESLIYVGGEILASKKTAYGDRAEALTEKQIAELMEKQHRTMIAAIKRGKFDPLLDGGKQRPVTEAGKTLAATPLPAPAVEQAIDDEKSLDQVILDYLAAEAESEHLELSILNPCDFVSGQSAELRVAARKSLSQNPVVGASIEVKMISTVEPPRVLFRGDTAVDGTVQARFNLPVFNEGTAAVIISAHSPLGNDEVKQLVKRKK